MTGRYELRVWHPLNRDTTRHGRYDTLEQSVIEARALGIDESKKGTIIDLLDGMEVGEFRGDEVELRPCVGLDDN